MRYTNEPAENAPHPADSRSPESEALRAELKDAIARAVMRLPENQRAVLLLAHYEQLPLAEVAQIMDIDIGAVKSRLQRARASLKEWLAAYAPYVGESK